jgi:myo-inositol 2-dehydrogenase/D-chiro-inositol 1-dehydrogenase
MKKLAFIGCGGINTYHLDHILKYTDVQIAGCCDIISERAQALAQKAGCACFTSYVKMYDTVQPDMVFIGIPPTAHGAVELETIRRGIPMFVEKPVALDMALARRIRDTAAQAGTITACGFQCRYSNLVEPTLKFTREHEILFVECARIGGLPGVAWWRVRSQSGGQLVEQTIHQLDMIRYAFGEPETVFSMGTRGFIKDAVGYDTDDLSVTAVKFASGALATISTGCYASSGAAFDSKISFGARDCHLDHYILQKVDVYGEKPSSADAGGLVFKGDGTLRTDLEGVHTYKDDGTAGDLCDRTFVEAVISGDPSKIRSPYADAVRSLAFGLACNQSMDSGLPVKVSNE